MTLALAVSSARASDDGADAYGNFEATEVTVAAEVGGRLLSFGLEEGDRVAPGQRGRAWWTRSRCCSSARRWWPAGRPPRPASRRRAPTSRRWKCRARIADRDLARTERLLKQAAATAQQGDRAERDSRMAGSSSPAPGPRRAARSQEVAALDAQVGLHRRPAGAEPDHQSPRRHRARALRRAGRVRAGGSAAVQARVARLAHLPRLRQQRAAHPASAGPAGAGRCGPGGFDRHGSRPGHLDRVRGRVHARRRSRPATSGPTRCTR